MNICRDHQGWITPVRFIKSPPRIHPPTQQKHRQDSFRKEDPLSTIKIIDLKSYLCGIPSK